jgi:hypothetical protein
MKWERTGEEELDGYKLKRAKYRCCWLRYRSDPLLAGFSGSGFIISL